MLSIQQLINEKKQKNQKVIIELGLGKIKNTPEAIGIDICQKDSVDYIADLNQDLIFLEDNSYMMKLKTLMDMIGGYFNDK